MSDRVSQGSGVDRETLLAEIGRTVPGIVADGLLFHSVVAERLGLNVTDLKVLNVLGEIGPVPAGELVERTALTTGGITRIVDRLERAGYVRRQPDDHDRRRIIIHPIAEKLAGIRPLYSGMAAAWNEALAPYTDADLAMLLDLLTTMRPITQRETAKLRADGRR